MAYVLLALTVLGALAAFILANTALSQIDAYGTVSVPGTKVVHLPADEVDISFATNSASTGGSFYTPGMDLKVTPASGSGMNPTITDSSGSASTIGSQTHARVWKMQVPNPGGYRITVDGNTSAYINPQLLFGQSPPDGLIVKLGVIALGGLVLVIILSGMVAKRADVRARVAPVLGTDFGAPPGMTFTTPGITVRTPSNGETVATFGLGATASGPQVVGQATQLDELAKLADLHERGVLTDAEFATEKARILGG
ncbi:MAG TPA: SHOCT domain-containing protein [Solirubrobacteraceae bacterium]